MHKRADLPSNLASSPFTYDSAMTAGVSAKRLRKDDVVHVSRRLYRPSTWNFELEAAARVLSEVSPGAWISHVTAARLHCQLLPAWLSDSTELHMSKPNHLPQVRRKGVIAHKVMASADEIETVDGIPISSRSRTGSTWHGDCRWLSWSASETKSFASLERSLKPGHSPLTHWKVSAL